MLTAGSTITVSYDALRVVDPNPRCAYEPSSADGVPRTSIDMGVKINGDDARVYNFPRVALYGAGGPHAREPTEQPRRCPGRHAFDRSVVFVPREAQRLRRVRQQDGCKLQVCGRWKNSRRPTLRRVAEFVQTGRKNALDVARWYDNSVSPGRDDSYYYPTHVEVASDDLDGFGGDQTTLTAQVGLHIFSEGHGSTYEMPSEWHTVTLARAGRRFVGQVDTQLWGTAGMTDVRVRRVEMAVTNGADWDSSFGANYERQLLSAQPRQIIVRSTVVVAPFASVETNSSFEPPRKSMVRLRNVVVSFFDLV